MGQQIQYATTAAATVGIGSAKPRRKKAERGGQIVPYDKNQDPDLKDQQISVKFDTPIYSVKEVSFCEEETSLDEHEKNEENDEGDENKFFEKVPGAGGIMV